MSRKTLLLSLAGSHLQGSLGDRLCYFTEETTDHLQMTNDVFEFYILLHGASGGHSVLSKSMCCAKTRGSHTKVIILCLNVLLNCDAGDLQSLCRHVHITMIRCLFLEKTHHIFTYSFYIYFKLLVLVEV